MKAFLAVLAAVLALLLIPAGPAQPQGNGSFPCTVQTIAGKWVFATDVGEVPVADPNHETRGITALGTFEIDRAGNLTGTFDNNVSRLFSNTGIPFSGTVEVNPDCTATMEFQVNPPFGPSRTDSLGIVQGGNELWGMSRDPFNLWNYRAKRVHGRR